MNLEENFESKSKTVWKNIFIVYRENIKLLNLSSWS